MGNIRNELGRMRERLGRNDLRPELRDSLEKRERHYAAKEAEFAEIEAELAAKVETPARVQPQQADEAIAPADAADKYAEATPSMNGPSQSLETQNPEPLASKVSIIQQRTPHPESTGSPTSKQHAELLQNESKGGQDDSTPTKIEAYESELPASEHPEQATWDEKRMAPLLIQVPPMYQRVFRDAWKNPNTTLSDLAAKHGIDELTADNILTAMRRRLEANEDFAKSLSQSSDQLVEEQETKSKSKRKKSKSQGTSKIRKHIYSVAFEMTLDDVDLGRSREVHFNRANAAIDEAMRKNPEFAELMERLSPGIRKRVTKKGGRKDPKGFTWHHAPELGLMQLVPKPQHTSGSTFWKALHYDPQSRGGYSIWAIPRGAPEN